MEAGRQISFRIAAETAANPDPIMVFVMSLLASATMTNDGILITNRASAQDNFRARLAQSVSRLPWAGESEINSIVTVGVPLATLAFPSSELEGGPLHLPSKKSRLEKNKAFRLAH